MIPVTVETPSNPSVASGASVTLLAGNVARRYLFVQNNSSANIMISLVGATLTGIAPTATNVGRVLVPGAIYENPPHFCPSSEVTVYQTSGGTIRTIFVSEA